MNTLVNLVPERQSGHRAMTQHAKWKLRQRINPASRDEPRRLASLVESKEVTIRPRSHFEKFQPIFGLLIVKEHQWGSRR